MFVDVQGIRTHYLVEGSGPPMVLVHGLGERTWTWRRVIGRLSGHFTVYALDLKGFGDSDKPEGADYSVPGMSRFVVAFMDALDINSAILVSHSFGGKTGVHVALEHPARVRGLVLLDSMVGPYRIWPTFRLLGVPRLGEVLVHTLESRRLVRLVLRGLHAPGYVASDEDVREFMRPVSTREGRRAFLAHFRAFLRDRADFESLGTLSVPTVIVWGREDRFVALKHGELLASRIPHAALHVLDGCGHSPHEDQPESLCDLLIGSFHAEGNTTSVSYS